jgi:AcrR family transcriptional regulator
MVEGSRADARRNHERLLIAAHEVFGKEGSESSLREIARRAGVGIGTLYRHFPTRESLLEALIRDSVEQLRDRADQLARTVPPERALITWLQDFVQRTNSYGGMPAAIVAALHNRRSDLYTSCEAMRVAAGELLARAQQVGAVRPDVTATELFALASGVALVADQMPYGKALVDRLLTLMMSGLAR